MEPISVATAVCTSDSIDRARASSAVLESTTPGVFMVPEGETQYNTFLEMMRAQPPKPDVAPYVPDEEEFEKLKEKMRGVGLRSKTGVMAKIDELMAEGMSFDNAFNIAQREQNNPIDLMSMAAGGDAGFPLDKMEEYDAEFRKMCEDMMLALPSETKILAGSLDLESVKRARVIPPVSITDPKEKWEAVNKQNELNESKTGEGNGGSTLNVSDGEQTVHTPPKTRSPLCAAVSETTASVVVPTIEEGGLNRTGSTA